MLKLVKDTLKINRDVVFVLSVFSVFISIFTLVIPIAVQTIVNTLAFSTLKQPLVILVIIVVIILVFAGLLRICQMMVVESVQQEIFVRIALQFARLLPRLNIRLLDEHRGPEIINRFFEIIPIQKTLGIILIYLLELFIQAITGLTLLALYHPYLLILDIFLIISFIAALVLPYKKALNTALAESDNKHKMVAWLEEYLHCPTLVKFSQNEDVLLDKVDGSLNEYLNCRQRHFKSILKHFIGFYGIYIMANAALLAIGGYLVIQQQLTLGQLVASEIVLNALVSSFLRFSYHLRDLYALAASSKKIDSVFNLSYEPQIDTQSTENGIILEIDSPPALTFDKISYQHPSCLEGFERVSLDIKPGAINTIYSEASLTKSTLLDILLGFSDDYQGAVRVNDIILSLEDKILLRERTVLLQDIEFFPGTLQENITLNKVNVSKEILTDYFRQFKILEDIENLPQRFNSYILKHRHDLTLATMYKICLIRALLLNPLILIIDEVLDKIPVDDVRLILSCLEKAKNKPTIIITTRRKLYKPLFPKVVTI